MKKQRSPLPIAVLLSLLQIVFCSCNSTPPCPPDGNLTAGTARAIFSKSLQRGETVKNIDITPTAESLSLTILAEHPDYFLLNVYPIMKASHQIAVCSQRLSTIQVLMVAPGANKSSEY